MMNKHQELKNNFKKDIKVAPQMTTSSSLQSGSVPIDLQIVEIAHLWSIKQCWSLELICPFLMTMISYQFLIFCHPVMIF